MLAYLKFIWDKIKRCKKFMATVLVMNFIVLVMIGYLCREGLYFLDRLERKIGIFEYYYNQQIVEILEIMKKTTEITMDNDKKQIMLMKGMLGIIRTLQDGTIALSKRYSIIKEKIKSLKTIDIENVDDIKRANLNVINISCSYGGSGSHIKIDGKSYILTCAHLTDNDNDSMWIREEGHYYHIELVKIDRKNDLALFRTKYGISHFPYFEISEESLKEGSEVIVIGNPGYLDDVLTDGIIAKTGKDMILVTNTIFGGSSGGAVLYRGKIVGVIKQILYSFFGGSYGKAVNLNTLKNFLKNIE